MSRLYKEVNMDSWQCRRCSYVYNPNVGDPDNDIAAGTDFEDLPRKWTCPECGAKINKFDPYEDDIESIEEEEE